MDLNQASRCLCCYLLPTQIHPHHPPSLQWPTCDHAESESYCVVDNLLTAAVHLMYRCVVCRGVSSGRRIPPAPSAQRKEKCQLANLEKKVVCMRTYLLYLKTNGIC